MGKRASRSKSNTSFNFIFDRKDQLDDKEDSRTSYTKVVEMNRKLIDDYAEKLKVLDKEREERIRKIKKEKLAEMETPCQKWQKWIFRLVTLGILFAIWIMIDYKLIHHNNDSIFKTILMFLAVPVALIAILVPLSFWYLNQNNENKIEPKNEPQVIIV